MEDNNLNNIIIHIKIYLFLFMKEKIDKDLNIKVQGND